MSLSLPSLQGTQAVDLALTLSGDLTLGPDGDLALIQGISVLQQEVIFRLKTKKGDYLYRPECGTELETLVGAPNSQDTANAGELMIRDALSHDGLINTVALEIYSWPISTDQIVFRILIDSDFYGFSVENTLSLEIVLDLKEGLIL